jgi:multiple sugar transport system permease protein
MTLHTKRKIIKNLEGYIAISPALLGIICLFIGPMIYSFYLSFTNYDVLNPPVFCGAQNYVDMFTDDPLFSKALINTVYYAFGSLIPRLLIAFFFALLLNQKFIRGLGVYRTLYYLPSVSAGAAIAIMWQYIYDTENGLMNYMLSLIGITGPPWLGSPLWAMPALIVMSVWQFGTPLIIFLAGLQSIPTHLYESATIDGANSISKTIYITIPMLSPSIFFNTVMGLIFAFQVFANVYILTDGGPINSTLVYVVYLYRRSFQWLEMGYGSAMAWFFFVLVFGLTLMQFRFSRWVYYEGKRI